MLAGALARAHVYEATPVAMRKILLLLFITSPLAFAEEQIDVWVLAIYRDFTQNIFQHYLDDLASELEIPLRTTFSGDLKSLESTCAKQKYQVLFVSYNDVIKRIAKECRYRVIAVTTQDVHLYVKRGTEVDAVHTVGLVSNTKASEVALDELIWNEADITYKQYSSLSSAVLRLVVGDIDALVSSSAGIGMTSTQIRNKLQIVHTYKEKGEGTVLFADTFYRKRAGKRLLELILKNRTSSRLLFIEKMGLSPWKAPEDQ